MARPVHTRPTGKGERGNGKKHLNASLPQQLVFDFNEVAKRQGLGRRDALVEEIFRDYLATVEPNSKSLREPPSSVYARPLRFSSREAAAVRQQVREHEVIRMAREQAQEIVEVTSAFVTRKPPKKTSPRSRTKRKAS